MFVVICYDIEDDKRRTRVHKTLKAFGENVQESVFETIVNKQQLQQMQAQVQRLLKQHDKIRYYLLCEGCQRNITGTHGHPSALRLPHLIL